jgi:hypothetical protein
LIGDAFARPERNNWGHFSAIMELADEEEKEKLQAAFFESLAYSPLVNAWLTLIVSRCIDLRRVFSNKKDERGSLSEAQCNR